MAVSCWESVHPLLKIIPVNWDHKIPLHAEHPNSTVERFLKASKTSL